MPHSKLVGDAQAVLSTLPVSLEYVTAGRSFDSPVWAKICKFELQLGQSNPY